MKPLMTLMNANSFTGGTEELRFRLFPPQSGFNFPDEAGLKAASRKSVEAEGLLAGGLVATCLP